MATNHFIEPFSSTTEDVGKNYVLNLLTRDASVSQSQSDDLVYGLNMVISLGLTQLSSPDSYAELDSTELSFSLADGGERDGKNLPVRLGMSSSVDPSDIDRFLLLVIAKDPVDNTVNKAVAAFDLDPSVYDGESEILISTLTLTMNLGTPTASVDYTNVSSS